jgi:hypothetical protein
MDANPRLLRLVWRDCVSRQAKSINATRAGVDCHDAQLPSHGTTIGEMDNTHAITKMDKMGEFLARDVQFF